MSEKAGFLCSRKQRGRLSNDKMTSTNMLRLDFMNEMKLWRDKSNVKTAHSIEIYNRLLVTPDSPERKRGKFLIESGGHTSHVCQSQNWVTCDIMSDPRGHHELFSIRISNVAFGERGKQPFKPSLDLYPLNWYSLSGSSHAMHTAWQRKTNNNCHRLAIRRKGERKKPNDAVNYVFIAVQSDT